MPASKGLACWSADLGWYSATVRSARPRASSLARSAGADAGLDDGVTVLSPVQELS
jgi:hypothetical protein